MLQVHKTGEATFLTSARYSVRGVFSVTLSLHLAGYAQNSSPCAGASFAENNGSTECMMVVLPTIMQSQGSSHEGIKYGSTTGRSANDSQVSHVFAVKV